ncbi:hypothetical protein T05_2345 [Trichinella murrelli]|uniref:Uncharacterized protein n=1 Tax=Trichinella murrelli TaxID=144512 RepID=A0A0V0U8W2_9BILA|nr:hypothetical protein T05_2345 [Trichinella murrelli]
MVVDDKWIRLFGRQNRYHVFDFRVQRGEFGFEIVAVRPEAFHTPPTPLVNRVGPLAPVSFVPFGQIFRERGQLTTVGVELAVQSRLQRSTTVDELPAQRQRFGRVHRSTTTNTTTTTLVEVEQADRPQPHLSQRVFHAHERLHTTAHLTEVHFEQAVRETVVAQRRLQPLQTTAGEAVRVGGKCTAGEIIDAASRLTVVEDLQVQIGRVEFELVDVFHNARFERTAVERVHETAHAVQFGQQRAKLIHVREAFRFHLFRHVVETFQIA